MQPFALERYFSRYEFSAKYTLSASDCESLTLEELLALADDSTLGLWHNLKLGYTETPGHPCLLEAISRLYESITPDRILVAAPEELIFIAMNVLLRKGDQVIVTSPAYQSLHEIAASIGSQIHHWELRPVNDGWQLDLKFLEDHVTDKTKLIVINFPHNPTGHHISAEDQREIIRIARRRNVVLFSDEMYRGAEYRADDRLPAITDIYERGISLWGLSKSFGLPGLRIGWIAANDADFLAKCSQFRDYLTICNSAPGEILGMIAARNAESLLKRSHRILLDNLSTADTFFLRHNLDLKWLRPKAGSVAFPELRRDIPIEEFCRSLIERKNLLITPGSLFQHAGNHFRVGIGRADFPKALALLEEALLDPRHSSV